MHGPGGVARPLAEPLQRPQRHGAADTPYQSQVTGDGIYRTHIDPNEQMIREHAQQGGFPADGISEVRVVIDLTAAKA